MYQKQNFSLTNYCILNCKKLHSVYTAISKFLCMYHKKFLSSERESNLACILAYRPVRPVSGSVDMASIGSKSITMLQSNRYNHSQGWKRTNVCIAMHTHTLILSHKFQNNIFLGTGPVQEQ